MEQNKKTTHNFQGSNKNLHISAVIQTYIWYIGTFLSKHLHTTFDKKNMETPPSQKKIYQNKKQDEIYNTNENTCMWSKISMPWFNGKN